MFHFVFNILYLLSFSLLIFVKFGHIIVLFHVVQIFRLQFIIILIVFIQIWKSIGIIHEKGGFTCHGPLIFGIMLKYRMLVCPIDLIQIKTWDILRRCENLFFRFLLYFVVFRLMVAMWARGFLHIWQRKLVAQCDLIILFHRIENMTFDNRILIEIKRSSP